MIVETSRVSERKAWQTPRLVEIDSELPDARGGLGALFDGFDAFTSS